MPYWFDGNNLIGLSAAAARGDRTSRAAFLSALSDWRGARGGRFLVWFDGDDPADLRPPSGVMVRYSAPESADAAICRHLREIGRPGEVIVVTNDRELSSRCRNAGAKVLDWNNFTLKMQASSTAPPCAAAEHSQSRSAGSARRIHKAPGEVSANVDVDDCLRFFGIDKH
jgi:hypothetical protein